MLKLKRLTKTEKIIFPIIFTLFLIYAAMLLYPFFFAAVASLKESGDAFVSDTIGFPSIPKFSNYLTAFVELELAGNNFLQMTFNSIWFSGGSAFLSIMSSTLAAYVVCKYKFKLRNFLYALALIIMMIPIYGALPATYRLYSALGMIDSPLILLSALGGFGFNFIIIYSFFKGISWDYAEAAFVDGGGHFQVFYKIMLPMAIPAMTAIMIMTFVGSWNNYEGPLMFLPNLPTLSSGLWSYEKKIQFIANQPVYFAGVIISLIPVVGIFLIFQNTIMQNIYAGGLKG